MKIKVNFGDTRKKTNTKSQEVFLPPNSSILDLLNNLQIIPDTVLIEKDGKIVPEETILADGDELRILSIISGG